MEKKGDTFGEAVNKSPPKLFRTFPEGSPAYGEPPRIGMAPSTSARRMRPPISSFCKHSRLARPDRISFLRVQRRRQHPISLTPIPAQPVPYRQTEALAPFCGRLTPLRSARPRASLLALLDLRFFTPSMPAT